MIPTIRRSALLLALAVLAQPALAQTDVTITPSKDNTLYESTNGDVSNGAGTYIFAGTTNRNEIRRAVLAFDVAAVPAGATIDSVRLTLNMSKTISLDHPASLHRLTSDWGEGASNASAQEGGGTTAETGDATWLHSSFNTDLWSSPGGDFDETASATAMVGSEGPYSWSTPEMAADVQAWLDDDSQNFGWILIGNESASATAKRYDSRESNNAPQLRVYYSLSTAIDETPERPVSVTLLSSFPNPFTTSTRVEYNVANPGHVRLDVYDTLGRRVSTLANGIHSPGRYDERFDAGDLPNGVYFVRIESGPDSRYRQVVLVR